jgi:cation diffusion facilitator family transporter
LTVPTPDRFERWRHDHSFGQDRRRPGETRTLFVIALTGAMMVIEIAAGAVYGSMALLADGLHMASHAVALGINAFAYVYARRHAHDEAYTFGTGKVNTLGGFAGAVLLAGFALLMAVESVERFVAPVAIAFDQAILVAVVGLVVNGVSIWILGVHDHGDGGGAGHGEHDSSATPARIQVLAAVNDHDHDHDHDHDRSGRHHDHNLASAYLHVLADALTSLLAIFALLAAKYFGFAWMDPAMGVVGAVLVARWSIGLLRLSGAVLLDRSAPTELRAAIRDSLERADGGRVVDLHVWCIGLGLYSVQATIVTPSPHSPNHYKAQLPSDLGIVHVSIEVQPLDGRVERDSRLPLAR